jgi:hypothetical protein
MVEAGGAVQRAAWTRLTDADLQWAIAFWLGEAEAEETTTAGGSIAWSNQGSRTRRDTR